MNDEHGKNEDEDEDWKSRAGVCVRRSVMSVWHTGWMRLKLKKNKHVWNSGHHYRHQGRKSWGWGLNPLKICRRVRVCFDPIKCAFFRSELLLDRPNSARFASSRMKDLCQKWKVKLIFSRHLQAVRNSLMAWSDGPWSPYFTIDLRQWSSSTYL